GDEDIEGAMAAGAAEMADGHLIDEGDVWYVTDAIPDGTSAAIALIEHRWAIPLRDKILAADGIVLADEWIHPKDLLAIGAAAAAVIAVLNAILPPVLAAARLPFMALAGFLAVLVLDALMLLAADHVTNGDLTIDSFWSAIGVALVAAAVGVALNVLLGTNDDDTYAFRVIQRIARRSGERVETDAAGIVFLEIDGLALPVLQLAVRDGSVPNMAS